MVKSRCFQHDFLDKMKNSCDAIQDLVKKSSSHTTSRPIFMLGMPHAGQKFLENLLTQHAKVSQGGELGLIEQMSQLEVLEFSEKNQAYPDAISTLGREHLDRMASYYLQESNCYVQEASWHVTDSSSTNGLFLGLIASLFPEAKFIYCRRNYRCSGLDCYLDWDLNITTTLTETQRFAEQHDALLVDTIQLLDLDVLTVDFSELITQPNAVLQDVQSYLALNHDSACQFLSHPDDLDEEQTRRRLGAGSHERWSAFRSIIESQ